ncbi:MAG: zinc transporter ZupT [Eubacteriaceae bacterium]
MNGSTFLTALFLTLLAGLATGLGGLISILFKKINDKYIAFTLSFSAGVMIYISFMEILPDAIDNINIYEKNGSYFLAVVIFFAGIGLMAIVNNFIDDTPVALVANLNEEKKRKQVLLVGIITFAGIIIHNIPEGMAAFMSSAYDLNSGIIIVIAISLHNIPEGLAVAGAIYYATHSRKKALKYTFISGMAEPAGGILAYFLFKDSINAFSMSIIYSVAAGVMVYIALEELLIKSRKYASAALCFFGWVIGMIVISLGLMLK